MTEANKKNNEVALTYIPYINYPIRFQKDNKNKMQVLINSGSKVNAITVMPAVT